MDHNFHKETVFIQFDQGTLLLQGPEAILSTLPGCRQDPRCGGGWRAPAHCYREIVEQLRRQGQPYEDQARSYEPVAWSLRISRDPYPHQREALENWWQQGGRGVVVLPTGTGKTFLALLAILRAGRPTLVLVPTLDLVNQWYHELCLAFETPVGLLGGGYYDLQPLTVATYDSAHLYVDRWGQRYGLLIFDECHHLPSPTYSLAAIGSLAPFRLGLTATPQRSDGQEVLLPQLIGPIVYRREIRELAGDFLAEYRVERLYVELTPEERQRYEQARARYRCFLEKKRISLGGAQGWQRFLQAASRSPEGRAALEAYREQKQLALAAAAKLQLLERLLHRHGQDRVLVFTYDNATAYHIARRFLLPIITHQTRIKERHQILQKFHRGDYPILVTSQVLNEGVDVPAANVGIVLSGTGSVREHVQRLGRLLRKQGDKQALLYEIVTRGTAEEYTSERRRQHHAYR